MGMQVLRRFSDVAKGGKGIVPGAITLVIVLGAVAFFLIPSRSVLVVQTVNPEAAVFCAQMTEGEEWMISYTHSVNRRPVYDFLRVEGNGLRILRSRYDAFGAGMPETATPENPLRTGPGRVARIHGQPPGSRSDDLRGKSGGACAAHPGDGVSPSLRLPNRGRPSASPRNGGHCISFGKAGAHGDR